MLLSKTSLIVSESNQNLVISPHLHCYHLCSTPTICYLEYWKSLVAGHPVSDLVHQLEWHSLYVKQIVSFHCWKPFEYLFILCKMWCLILSVNLTAPHGAQIFSLTQFWGVFVKVFFFFFDGFNIYTVRLESIRSLFSCDGLIQSVEGPHWMNGLTFPNEESSSDCLQTGQDIRFFSYL